MLIDVLCVSSCSFAGAGAARSSARSSASKCSCIVETFLSAIVCEQAFEHLVTIDDVIGWWDAFTAVLGLRVLSLETLGGVERFLRGTPGRRQRYLRSLGFAHDLVVPSIPDGVDPFEYTDVISASSLSRVMVFYLHLVSW